jgi:SHS2 domain-containing protein
MKSIDHLGTLDAGLDARDAAAVTAGTRRHVPLPHTADAGFMAAAATLPQLFEEAAMSLTELTANVAPGLEPSVWESVDLDAGDLTALAYGWLNELIALSDVHHGVVVAARVSRIDGPIDVEGGSQWRLRGRIGFRLPGDPGIVFLRQPKSATYHGLAVEHQGSCWTMRAYLDL